MYKLVLYYCCCLVSESCPTLCDPWAVACHAPLSMGFPRQEYRIGLPFPPPQDLPGPGIEPWSSALAGGFFTAEPRGSVSACVTLDFSYRHNFCQHSCLCS